MNTKNHSPSACWRLIRPGLAVAVLSWCGLINWPANCAASEPQAGDSSHAMKVDFSYAFGLPHRMTVALPDSSDKTIIDVQVDHLGFRWTYGNLLDVPFAEFMPLRSSWTANVWPQVDGKPLPMTVHARSEGALPVLHTSFAATNGITDLEVVGGATAAITHVKVTNNSNQPHRYNLVFAVNGTLADVPGYINPGDPTDYVLAGWQDRADRVLALALGAETPLQRNSQTKSIALEWNLKPGETGTGWLVRPYRAYEEDVPKLRAHDWSKEFEQGKKVWRELLGRTVRFQIPDEGIRNAYYACIGDIFIMREPVADGYLACCPGTETYRSPNSGESSMAAIGLDQAGLPKESVVGYRLHLDLQGKDGNWCDPKGWTHRMWGIAGFKAWTAMEHYRLTRDRSYLKNVYPRMLACSRWQEQQRQRTRVLVDGQRPLYYGLMPRGVGDCGLDAGDGLYGYFLPHNAWAVFADKLAIEAAEILGRANDVAELRGIYERADKDFLIALDQGAIPAEGYRWIPGSPGNPVGSQWGALNTAFPCGLLSPNDELITGTLKHMNQHLSKSGLQIHTGWMVDGMWVAISLDNVAEVELTRNNGDEAARLLYACLNHGTPLYTWCEERGQEAGTLKTSGDRQHLWTPAAVVRAVRDSMVMEDNHDLHLARGAARQWLASGQTVGAMNAPTHFGPVSYELRYEPGPHRVTGSVNFPGKSPMQNAVLHIRLPQGLALKSVNAQSGATLLPDGTGIAWQHPAGEFKFVAEVSP